MKANRKRRTGAATAGNSQKKNNSLPSTDPDDLLNALVERDRVETDRVLASLAADDERIARLLDELARDPGADIDAMLAAERITMDRLFAELDRQDIGAELDAMLAADDDRIARLLAEIVDQDKGRQK